MQRRNLIAVAAAGALALTLPAAHAQVVDLSDAINKAGRQRMLSQRMGKAWLAIANGSEKLAAQGILEKSIGLFELQLSDLKAFATATDIRDTYGKLDAEWGRYKAALVGTTPSRENAANMLQLNAAVLALAHKGTVQFEAVMGKPVGKLVNVAGRQRMLSQRMAMFFFSASLSVQPEVAHAEIDKARKEFVTAMDFLRSAPQTTPRIAQELQLADGQWVFFNAALERIGKPHADPSRPLTEVFIASENLLAVMDQVTGMYSSLKT